ncbi:MAG: hypothetical protein AAGF49_11865, partial [Pseudomonadota bacterium]
MSAPPPQDPPHGPDRRQTVTLVSATPRTLHDAAEGGASTPIDGVFLTPERAGRPTPAALIGTAGARDAALRTASLLAANGVAALVVDSAD